MVCPYCSNKNVPNSPVCSNCGVILRAIKTTSRAPKRRITRSATLRLVAIGIAAIAGAVAGAIIVRHFRDYLPITPALGAVIGALTGALLVYTVSGAKVMVLSNFYRFQYNRLQKSVRGSLSGAEHRYERDLKKSEEGYKTRLDYAVTRLLQDEVEQSVQQFQQAQKLGADDVSFFNNAGIALARRGSVAQSVEMFERAAGQNGHIPQPHANLAKAIARVSLEMGEKESERALLELETTMKIDGRKPSHLNQMGLILCRQGHLDEAFKAFSEALELSEGLRNHQADSANNLGLVELLRGDQRKANAAFQNALRYDASHGAAISNVGLIYLLQGNTSDAVDLLRKARMLDPANGAIRCNLGYALCRANALNDAISEFRESTQLDASLFEAFYNLGKIYADEDLHEFAVRYLTRAVQLNPLSWEAFAALGAINLRQRYRTQAMEFFQKALVLAPDQPSILINLGVCQTLIGEHEEAEKTLRRAAQIDSTNAEVFAHLALLYICQDEPLASANELHHATELSTTMPELHNNFAVCQIGMGAYDLALSHLRKALALDPNVLKVRYQIGYIHALQKKIDPAIKEWQAASKQEPGFADCYANLGVGYYLKNMLDEAITEFRRVIAIRQNRVDDYSNLALCYAKQGMAIKASSRNPQDAKIKAKAAAERHTLAIDMLDRAIALEPGSAMLHSNRGLACFFSNRPEDAMKEWTAVTHLDPLYARRRGKKQQTEFDESTVNFQPISLPDRFLLIPPRTADFMYHVVPGYDTESWALIIDDPELVQIPEMNEKSRRLERNLQALKY